MLVRGPMGKVPGFALSLIIGLCMRAQAASVNLVLTGSTTMSGTNTTVGLCDSVDLTKSILLYTITNSTNSVGGNLVGGELTNETTITFNRDGSNGTVSIVWQIIEFSSGVTVQRGSTSISGSTINQSITAVGSLTNSFAIVNMRNNGGTWGTDDGVVADLTTTSNLQFRCSASGFTAYWQVVEYDSCSVQRISSTLNASSTSTTTSLTAVTTGKTMIIGSHYQNGNINADDMPRTELTNSTTVTHTRVGSASTITYYGYAIEFTDNTTVQHGSFSFGSSDASVVETVSSYQTDRSLIFGTSNYGSQGSTPYNSDDNVGRNYATMDLTSSTSVTGTRSNTGSTGEIPYQIASFRYDQTDPPSGASDLTDPTGPFDNMYLNRIEKGTVTLSSGSTSTTATIASVDPDSSFLVFSARVNSSAIGNGLIRGEITNSTTLTFNRAASDVDAIIEYQVFYFASGVYVQHGSTTVSSSPQTESISSVDLTKSFVIMTYENVGTVYGADDGVVADLTSSTELQFRGNPGDQANYQVIQMEDALVRNVQFTLANGQTSATSSISTFDPSCGGFTNGVELDRTFIVSNHTLSNDINSDDAPRIALTDTNEITATRVGTTGDKSFVVYVVELFDSSVVQHGSISISGTNTSNTGTITSVDEYWTAVVPPGHQMRQGSSTFNSDDDLGQIFATYELTNATTVTVTRAENTSATSIFPYQVVTFDNHPQFPLPVELVSLKGKRSIDHQVDLSWSTSSEINNSGFHVERSLFGKDWQELGFVVGKGNSNEKMDYGFIDEDAPTSTLYYRLKQVDFNGTIEYSDVVKVDKTNANQDLELTIFPNPARDVLHISTPYGKQLSLELLNSQGQIADPALSFSFNQKADLHITELPEGLYFLHVYSQGHDEVFKVIVSR